VSKSNVLGRIPLTARIGLAFVLMPLAVLGVCAGWYFTRSWEPVNMPISLARGHIRTGFDINVESTYAIELDFSQDRVPQRHPCSNDSMDCDSVSLAGAPWSVSTGGKLFASGRGQPALEDLWQSRSIGAFQCGKGHYFLDIDPLADQSRLNFYEPHLVIYEAGGKGNSDPFLGVGLLSLMVLLLFGPVGASMIILAAVHWRQEKLAALFRSVPLTQAGPAPARFLPVAGRTIATSHRMKSAMPRPFARLSQTSLVLVLTLFVVWTPLVLSHALDLVPTGLFIHVIRPGVVTQASLGLQPLRVRVASGGRGRRPTIYVDSQIVAWEDLAGLLKKELSRRPPDWPVYVEGDPDLEWRQVAEAIDAVRGQPAQVVLLAGAANGQ